MGTCEPVGFISRLRPVRKPGRSAGKSNVYTINDSDLRFFLMRYMAEFLLMEIRK
jgi:hypothetical protein